jgi:hypothetical protein
MGLFDAIAEIPKAKYAKEAAGKSARDAREARTQGLDMVANQDWEPELASDHIGTYQRSQSPVARSFLESFLTGNNPAAVQDVRLGSQRDAAKKQAGFDQAYGGFDQLRRKQRAMEEATPWAVKPFEGPAITQRDRRNVEAPGLSKFGITPEDQAALKEWEIELDPATGLAKAGPNGTPMRSMTRGMPASGLVKPENIKRMATALRAGDTDLAHRIYMGHA